MAAKKITVDYASLDDCVKKARAKLNSLGDNISYVEKNGFFTSNEWSGENADVFNEIMREYIVNLKGVKDAVSKMATFIENASNNYSSIDRLK